MFLLRGKGFVCTKQPNFPETAMTETVVSVIGYTVGYKTN